MYTFLTPDRIRAAAEAEVADFFRFWNEEQDGPRSADQVKARVDWHLDRAAEGDIEMLKPFLGIHPILLHRKEEAAESLKKLARKAERYGTPAITWTWGETFYEDRKTESGRKYKIAFQDLILGEIAAPKVGAYTFVARLEVTPAGTIIDAVPGETLPERFRNSTGECEHCKQNRARKDLFVVRDPEGKLVQVGRTCLRDYMGTDTPNSVAARFRWERELREWSEDMGARGKPVPDSAIELLAVTAAAIRLWGWVPRSAPESAGTPTANRIDVWFTTGVRSKRDQIDYNALKATLTEADYALAEQVIDWVQTNEDRGEYMHNLRVILAPGAVEAKRRGYACSAVASYQREMAKREAAKREAEAAQERSASEFVGKVGDRLKGLELTVLSSRGFNGAYGSSVLYKFADAAGNVLTWFASADVRLEVGQTYRLTATVKGHNSYQGVQETQITRGKVE